MIKIILNYFFQGIVIKTENGKIKGRIDYTVEKNKTYYAFQGIPYAKSPIGDLRFQVNLNIHQHTYLKFFNFQASRTS